MEGEFDFEFWAARREAAARYQQGAIWLEERAKGHPQLQVVCRYWLDGQCSAGPRCFYRHVYLESMLPLCVFLETGCPDGLACNFRHYYRPGEHKNRPRRVDPQRAPARE